MPESHKVRGKTGAERHRLLAAAGRKYTCRQCGDIFESVQALGGHTSTHIDLICPICGEQKNGLAMRGHLQLHRFIEEHSEMPVKKAAYLYAKGHGFSHH